ncbi:MAG: bifunctional aldolase/short-chain dehydrogenase [Gammaproteobacteria bacterium]|nr:bifunctional aldolase/short-chain dehydrogenase [Gammaproteobacteria bacterium]
MKNLWNDEQADECHDDLDLRVYTSRLLGREKSLVLHGGGNTSVKIKQNNLLGNEEDVLYIKGSGWDLETIEKPGFSPVLLDHLIALSKLKQLSDPQMVNALRTHMTDAAAPTPSVETILHALLPFKFVDHTHANAVVTVTNTAGGLQRIKEIYANKVIVIPYVMPGFDLARVCAEIYEKESGDETIGMVLMNHGIFSFGDTAKESYERMIYLVGLCEDYLKQQQAWELETATVLHEEKTLHNKLAQLRKQVSQAAGFSVVINTECNAKTLRFSNRDDLAVISQQGPATPDHVIRTKRLPMLGTDVASYVAEYKKYFSQHLANSKNQLDMLDPAPRVILDAEMGLCTVGRNATGASIVRDIYIHTMDIIERATALGGFQALPADDIFSVEYWDLEQAKLGKNGNKPMFSGEVAIVTGAASGIGKACVDSLLRRGAAVIGLDIDATVTQLHQRADYLGVVCDVTDEKSIDNAIEEGVRQFGGLDMVILNAGVFPASCRIDEMNSNEWQKTLDINLTANLLLMKKTYTFLKLAYNKGRVVIVGSKNVSAPGPGAGAYSASKAALNQLMRVAAMEWGSDGIRINTVHPNAVFDTAIWTDEVLESRAKSYGLSVGEYKKRNIMSVEITSHDVAELVSEMCGPVFAKITGAQVPIDGGNERVI